MSPSGVFHSNSECFGDQRFSYYSLKHFVLRQTQTDKDYLEIMSDDKQQSVFQNNFFEIDPNYARLLQLS